MSALGAVTTAALALVFALGPPTGADPSPRVGVWAAVFPQAPPPLVPSVPGARNPDVTQATIGTTVCVRGWTATVRPSRSWSAETKRHLLRYYRLPGTVAAYQLDHLLSLEVGGEPYLTSNLWLQPKSQAKRDDAFENEWRMELCAGHLTLRQAQRAEVAYKRANG